MLFPSCHYFEYTGNISPREQKQISKDDTVVFSRILEMTPVVVRTFSDLQIC